MYVGKQAIISPGELFPNPEKQFTREQIDEDIEYSSRHSEDWKKRLKYDNHRYQLWLVAAALGEGFTNPFHFGWGNPELFGGINFDLRYVDGQLRIVDGKWKLDNHYEVEVVPMGPAKDLQINPVQGLSLEQELYRLFVKPFCTYPAAFKFNPHITAEQLEAKTRELYQRFVDPKRNIVSQVVLEEK